MFANAGIQGPLENIFISSGTNLTFAYEPAVHWVANVKFTPLAAFLNPFFTVTGKSQQLRQTTRAKFDCLSIGTRGETEGAVGRAGGSEPDQSMNSRVWWSTEGIDPSVRERAEAAARRAGLSLSEWINTSIGEPAPPSFAGGGGQRGPLPAPESRGGGDTHQRLDSITRQIEQISRPVSRQDLPRHDMPRQELPRQE